MTCLIVTCHLTWMPLRVFILYCDNLNKVFCTLFTRLFGFYLAYEPVALIWVIISPFSYGVA